MIPEAKEIFNNRIESIQSKNDLVVNRDNPPSKLKRG